MRTIIGLLGSLVAFNANATVIAFHDAFWDAEVSVLWEQATWEDSPPAVLYTTAQVSESLLAGGLAGPRRIYEQTNAYQAISYLGMYNSSSELHLSLHSEHDSVYSGGIIGSQLPHGYAAQSLMMSFTVSDGDATLTYDNEFGRYSSGYLQDWTAGALLEFVPGLSELLLLDGHAYRFFTRVAPVTARARSLPSLTWTSEPVRLSNMNWVSPATMAMVAGAEPL